MNLLSGVSTNTSMPISQKPSFSSNEQNVRRNKRPPSPQKEKQVFKKVCLPDSFAFCSASLHGSRTRQTGQKSPQLLQGQYFATHKNSQPRNLCPSPPQTSLPSMGTAFHHSCRHSIKPRLFNNAGQNESYVTPEPVLPHHRRLSTPSASPNSSLSSTEIHTRSFRAPDAMLGISADRQPSVPQNIGDRSCGSLMKDLEKKIVQEKLMIRQIKNGQTFAKGALISHNMQSGLLMKESISIAEKKVNDLSVETSLSLLENLKYASNWISILKEMMLNPARKMRSDVPLECLNAIGMFKKCFALAQYLPESERLQLLQSLEDVLTQSNLSIHLATSPEPAEPFSQPGAVEFSAPFIHVPPAQPVRKQGNSMHSSFSSEGFNVSSQPPVTAPIPNGTPIPSSQLSEIAEMLLPEHENRSKWKIQDESLIGALDILDNCAKWKVQDESLIASLDTLDNCAKISQARL